MAIIYYIHSICKPMWKGHLRSRIYIALIQSWNNIKFCKQVLQWIYILNLQLIRWLHCLPFLQCLPINQRIQLKHRSIVSYKSIKIILLTIVNTWNCAHTHKAGNHWKPTRRKDPRPDLANAKETLFGSHSLICISWETLKK